MGDRFHASVRRLDGETRVRLAGVIDEDEELGSVLDQIQRGRVEIDLGEVERINSLGVRQWIHWISEVERRGGVPVLARCSRAIVSQVNLIHNFTGNIGAIHSFYAPYFCERCDREQQLLLDVSEMGEPPHHAPRIRCDSCDQLMEFDDIEDGYFAFLGRQGPPAPRRRSGGTLPPPVAGTPPSPGVRSQGTRPGPGVPPAPAAPPAQATPSAHAAEPSSPWAAAPAAPLADSPSRPVRPSPPLEAIADTEPFVIESSADEQITTSPKPRYQRADLGATFLASDGGRSMRRFLMGLAAAFLALVITAAILLTR